MNQANFVTAPVVIGGVGGSGTRVVAEMLKQLGYFIGPVNQSNDNLLFAKTFGHPQWFLNQDKQGICHQLNGFHREMLRLSAQKQGSHTGWGWKNPVTHIYLEHLAATFENMKYILVIRNGLEMAFSSNQNQVVKWGRLFNIITGGKPSPRQSLHYWYRANERAISLGKSLLGRNFYVLNFNQLCKEPKAEIVKLLEFLQLNPAKIDVHHLATLIRRPSTEGRYKEYLSLFTNEDLQLTRKLGFNSDCNKKL
ncbi:sulfotransferase [Bacillus rubiinfantis]|uniref:sulfotransferase n=1 Tax=Bacillus rubiinfantis TaxID=1499680 RepID=UPI0005A94065|nr:sulfotransferase [Bacillus rubiinfantis]